MRRCTHRILMSGSDTIQPWYRRYWVSGWVRKNRRISSQHFVLRSFFIACVCNVYARVVYNIGAIFTGTERSVLCNTSETLGVKQRALKIKERTVPILYFAYPDDLSHLWFIRNHRLLYTVYFIRSVWESDCSMHRIYRYIFIDVYEIKTG